jgi:hypothetical protein
MYSSLSVTIRNWTGPVLLGELAAVPASPFANTKFQSAKPSGSASASGNLSRTGPWGVSVTLVDARLNRTEECRLESVSVTCLPTFVEVNGGCECRVGQHNVNGSCVAIATACAAAQFRADGIVSPKTGAVSLTDNSTVGLSFLDGRDVSNIVVLMRTKVDVRPAPASNVSALLGLGRVSIGTYEIELDQAGVRCVLLDSVNVGCADGYVATGVGGTCRDSAVRCDASEWQDQTTRKCRLKAAIVVQATTTTLAMTLIKTMSVNSSVTQLQVRLKSGDVDAIQWSASLSLSDTLPERALLGSWLRLGSPTGVVSTGVVSTARPVDTIAVFANAAGLNDTYTTGPLTSTITVRGTSASGPVFVEGGDTQTIAVQLTIRALPYISDSHVLITDSAARVVRPGGSVSAGDRLTVSVTAVDADGLPICRPDIQLAVAFRGKLNGDHRATLESDGSPNVYTASISELWLRDPEEIEVEVSSASDPPFRMTFTVVPTSSNIVLTGSVAGGIAAVLLLASLYLLYRHGTRAKAIIVSLVTGEARTAFGCFGEVFDYAGDAAMFLAITADAQSSIQSIAAPVAPIVVPVWVAFCLASTISAVALVTKLCVLVMQVRRRRLDVAWIGREKPYTEHLATKIEDAERTIRTSCLGAALGLCEDLPMTGIAAYFLVQKYNIPPLQVASMVTSGIMLGIKAGSVMALPGVWSRLGKWRARVAPVSDSREPGAELTPVIARTRPAPVLTTEQYTARLMDLHAAVADLAETPSADQAELRKWATRITMMVAKAEDAPKAATKRVFPFLFYPSSFFSQKNKTKEKHALKTKEKHKTKSKNAPGLVDATRACPSLSTRGHVACFWHRHVRRRRSYHSQLEGARGDRLGGARSAGLLGAIKEPSFHILFLYKRWTRGVNVLSFCLKPCSCSCLWQENMAHHY